MIWGSPSRCRPIRPGTRTKTNTRTHRMLVDCAQTKEKYSTEIINYPLPPACEAAPVGFDYQDVHIWGVGYNVRAAPVDRGDSCCQKCVVKYRVSSPAWSVIFQMYNLGFVYRKICTKTHPCGEKKSTEIILVSLSVLQASRQLGYFERNKLQRWYIYIQELT